MRQISDDLKNTLITHANVKEVHFSAKGHHFNVYEYKGVLYGRILESQILDPKTNKMTLVRTPILATRILETHASEALLGGEENEEREEIKEKRGKNK